MSSDEFEAFRHALRKGATFKKRVRSNGNIIVKYRPTSFSLFNKRIELSYSQAQELGIHDLQRGAKAPPTDVTRASSYQ